MQGLLVGAGAQGLKGSFRRGMGWGWGAGVAEDARGSDALGVITGVHITHSLTSITSGGGGGGGQWKEPTSVTLFAVGHPLRSAG